MLLHKYLLELMFVLNHLFRFYFKKENKNKYEYDLKYKKNKLELINSLLNDEIIIFFFYFKKKEINLDDWIDLLM